eukprot:TRINITY_DN9790_c0_g1_i1.p1 TRINITY_DN9790_c0_g1~~TRINITY_DN9790_c0_g1_i1.p1  ORF type:complete len:149 (+),score=24.70 TRINITY_DN9790_c0_g1_i1:140-586(+)
MAEHQQFMKMALEEAQQGLREGGIPIGAVLVKDGQIIGRGRNQRIQKGSVIHHGEMNCFENAGRLKASDYAKCVLYTTLSPCPMCSGAIVLYSIPKVIVGERQNFLGSEEYLRQNNIVVEVLDDPDCTKMMKNFIDANPELWNEDIGV